MKTTCPKCAHEFEIQIEERGKLQKKGMLDKAVLGRIMSRPAFGYKIQNKKLVPAENYEEIEEIFEDFLQNPNLTKIAKQHSLSVNGLKKILRNFTYLGKIKFNNQVYQGEHKPLISSTLFNHVQDKLDGLG